MFLRLELLLGKALCRVMSSACSEGRELEKKKPNQKNVSWRCSALVVRPPRRDPVPVIAGLLHRRSLKRCQLLPMLTVVFVLCLPVIELVGFGSIRREKKKCVCCLTTACRCKANSLHTPFKRNHLGQSDWYTQPYF